MAAAVNMNIVKRRMEQLLLKNDDKIELWFGGGWKYE